MQKLTPESNPGNCTTESAEASAVARRPNERDPGIGVYLHFPYCLRKCPYCDFASFEASPDAIDHATYADGILAELERRREALHGRILRSIFIGGGTPSLWDPTHVGRVLEAIRAAAQGVDEPLEITLEANPSSLDASRAKRFVEAGVTRFSVGVQGLDARRLAFLGRLHDGDRALRAIEDALESGATRVSGDFIYAVAGGEPLTPGQSAAEATRIAAAGVHHLSAYGLTIEPGTPFGAKARRGRLPIASDDVAADSFLAIREELAARGFEHYEVSSYARRGDAGGESRRCRHNADVWAGGAYLGLGSSAVGAYPDERGWHRYRNEPNPSRYLAATAAGLPTATSERLDPESRLRERIMLGLRTSDGLDGEAAARELGVEFLSPDRRRAIERHVSAGRLEHVGGHLVVPPQAWLFCDGIAADLF